MRIKILILGVLVILLSSCSLSIEDDEEYKLTPAEPFEDDIDFDVGLDVTADRQELYNEDNIIIDLVDYRHNAELGDSVVLLIQNNRGENIQVVSDYISINGYEIAYFQQVNVDTGDSSAFEINIPIKKLARSGLTVVGDVSIKFTLLNPDTGEVLQDGHIPVYFKTSAYADRSLGYRLDSNLLYSEGNIDIYGGDFTVDDLSNKSYQEIYLRNYTETDILLEVDTIRVNGTEVSINFTHLVSAGGMLHVDIPLTNSDKQTKDIKPVETVEFSVTIKDYNTHQTIDTSDIMKFQ